jgi:hypothetical protein
MNYAPPMWSKARGATMSDNDTCAAKFFRGWSEYIAVVVVAVCALISFPAEAKHATLKDQPDDQTQNPASAKDEPQSGKSTVIKGEFVEVRDRLSPAALSGIRRKHTFTVTMSTHHVDEEWTDSDMRLRTFGKRNPKITRQDSDSATIGDASQPNGTMAEFSLPQAENASCTIQ